MTKLFTPSRPLWLAARASGWPRLALVEPDRAEVGARQAGRGQARAHAHRRRTPAALVRSPLLLGPPAVRTTGRL